MRRTISRYVGKSYLATFVTILLALVTVFLVIDFVDRAKNYTGDAWLRDVLTLYANKAVVVIQQLGPAALLLAAGATMSSIQKRGELTALEALGFGWHAHLMPIGLCAVVVAVGLIGFDEWAVGPAAKRADEISAVHFHRWGDWITYYQPKQWFRRGDRVFYLRAGEAENGFEDATILRFDAGFKLVERIDAAKMAWVAGGRWRLEHVADRTFDGPAQSTLRTYDVREYELDAPVDAFRIRKGKPEQMRLRDLLEQIDAREDVGLPTTQFLLALHNRFAYPLAGVPAAMLAVALALRPGRKSTLTVAIFEGLLIAAGMWGLMVVSKTLTISDRMPPAMAAWLPFAVLAMAAGTAWSHRERGKWTNARP
ncbi:MAG: LptF/LptG family permease [Myxococcaceae bacterium]|nr:LptF/LptG family permease [Myxococcaceae bacterium]